MNRSAFPCCGVACADGLEIQGAQAFASLQTWRRPLSERIRLQVDPLKKPDRPHGPESKSVSSAHQAALRR